MKKLAKITLLTFVAFGFFQGYTQCSGNERVVGNGNVVTKTISVGEYDAIKSRGFMDVHLEKGTEGNITITTDENLQQYIKAKVKDDVLILSMENNVSVKTKKGVHIAVPFESLSKVTLVGSGDVDTKDVVKAGEFEASVMGSGDVDLEVEAAKVVVDVSGSGDIMLSGAASHLEVSLKGSGDFEGEVKASRVLVDIHGSGDAVLSGSTSNLEVSVIGSGGVEGFRLNAQDVEVSVAGSGEAKVVAEAKLRARVSGTGEVIYKGNPEQVDVKTSGSGEVSAY